MCFSPSASFTSSAVLCVTGIIAFTSAGSTPQKVLAGIPFVFSVQQFTEGVLWMSLLHPPWARWEMMATYGFQIFAQLWWPVYIPLSIWLLEYLPAKRKIMLALLCGGIVLSCFTGYFLYKYPQHALADCGHIRYETNFPLAKAWYYGLLYFIPTILAPLLSSHKILRWLGVLFLASYIIARILFHYFEISVWCFFGAMISILVVFMVKSPQRFATSKS
jgi:hypothetical protein